MGESWNKHKSNADIIAKYYSDRDDYEKYASRINWCSQFLDFKLLPDNSGYQLRLHGARFCRVRYCPICQWRRSLKWKAKAFKVMPEIIKDYPTHRWLFLTLTVKNCPIEDLRTNLHWLSKSWQRLSQRKIFPAVGWLRSTEITKSKDNTAHPHFHCLLLVKASYFGKLYLKQDDWVELWRDSLKVDYDPIVDIRAIKKECQPIEIIPEILKYCVKESDLTNDRQWLWELTNQTHNIRTVATGGILKEYLKQSEEDKQWIMKDSSTKEETINIYFNWRYNNKNYQLLSNS